MYDSQKECGALMAGTLQLVGVSRSPVRIQTFLIENQSFMLVNPDIVNNIFIGNDPGSQIIAVPPLGSITLDASKHDVWVSTNGGNYTVQAFLMPNGSNWVPSPAQVAAQINALGLAKDTTLQTTNANTSATKTSVDTVNFTVSAGTNPAVQQLGGAAGRSVAQDMLNANQGVTTELSALIATGTPGGTPGGVPVLRGTTNIGVAIAQTIGASVLSTLVSNFPIAKPSFETILQLNLPAGVGTVPFAILGINWSDSNTGLTVGFKQYVLTAGNGPSNVLTYYISGPCRGNQLSITLQNLDPAQTLTYTIAINQTSHVYSVDRLLQPSYATTAPITFQNPAGNPSKGALLLTQPTIAQNTSTARLSACCNAKAKISIDNSGGALQMAVNLNDPGGVYNGAAAGQALYKFVVAAGGATVNEIQFPNGPFSVSMSAAAGAGSITPSVAITAMEY